MDVDWKLWLPVLLSIPTSILAGLLVGPVRRLLESWAGKGVRAKRAERIKQKTREFIDFSEIYTQYLILAAIRLLIFLGIAVTTMLDVMLGIGLISVAEVQKIPIPVKFKHTFLIALTLNLILSSLSSAAFSAQVMRCFVWWMRVQDMRNELQK